MRRKGFTLIELLIVMAIIALLMSILLPCLLKAKESAYELFANKIKVDKDGKVELEINKPSKRKAYDDIYMIEINRPMICDVSLKKPYPSGMKLIRRDRQDYIKWRPKLKHVGVHDVTVIFKGEETSEKEIKIYVKKISFRTSNKNL